MESSAERFRWTASDPKANGTIFGKEDSSSKLINEEELDLGDAVLTNSSCKETSFHFEGVRFSPRVIEFIDAFEGKQFSVKIKIQNVGIKPVLVKIGEPNSFIFQLKKPSRRIKLLASGSSLTKTITYSYHNDDLVQRSQIPVQINGRLVDYPIVVKKAVPDITVEPSQLNFKQINLGASAKTMLLTIHNSGGKRTKFEIDLGKNDLELVVNPVRGTIKAKSQVNVVVEMMGMTEGEYLKELWVTTTEMCTRVPVLVEVVRPRLEIIHPNVTEDFVLIDFPPTFIKTQRTESFLLKNYSADTTLFISLAEIEGNLQFLKNARQVHDICKMFMFTAEEGRLEPFESRVLTALFQPKAMVAKKGWQHTEAKEKKKKEFRTEHILFVRMNRVHCIEIEELAKVETRPLINTVKERSGSVFHSNMSVKPTFSSPSRNIQISNFGSGIIENAPDFRRSSNILTNSSLEEKVLRLCLHGTVIEPNVLVEPSSFKFDSVKVGRTDNKVLKLNNQSVVAVGYKFHKMTNLEVKPDEGWLQPNQAKELIVSLTPTYEGEIESEIKIDILGKSEVVFKHDKDLVIIATLFVPVYYVGEITSIKVKPKIGLGISPLVTDEVGFSKELMTFKSDFLKPRAAMLCSLKIQREWMKKEPDKVGKVDNAIIAFPNDRPRNFRTWPKEKICRTIFKGFFRYNPPEDESYTLTSEEKELKRQHNLIWKEFLKQNSNVRSRDKLKENQICDNQRTLKDYKPSNKLLPNKKLTNALTKFMQKKEDQPKNALVPLSPQHLNNINVEPKLINFGTVAVNNLVHETLSIFNMNPFPIGIHFVPGKSAVKVVEGDTIVIMPFFTKSLVVSFQTKDLGRHYGFLNYIINSSHQFKITISAYVTSKTLMLEDKNLVIEFGNYPAENAFQPRCTFLELRNLLQSPIKYHWELPIDSPYVTDIIGGEVPPRAHLVTEIKFAMAPRKPFYSELNLISESGSTEIIKLIYPNRTVSVGFLTNRIDMGEIPLNLPTKVTPIIQNACYHEVVFDVLDWNPMPGVVVEPKQGVLKPRSFFALKVIVQIPVAMAFSFDATVFIHMCQKISVKITGKVAVPLIKIKPTEIVMRKICSQSFDTMTLCIENAGTTPAEIDIDFQACPEFKVADDMSHLFLLPSKFSKVNIRFQPTDVARYVFYLPIIINKILGPPLMQEPKAERLAFYISDYEELYESYGTIFRSESFKTKIPCICINSTVTPSLLTISSLNVIFQPIGNLNSKFQSQKIVISNDFTESVTFCIRTDDLGEPSGSPFDLIPLHENAIEYRTKSMKAQLKQGEKLVFNAKFSPKAPGMYKVDVPIFVKGYSNGIVYNYISLKGELKRPRLHASSKELHFPPLPLNIGCDVVISVIAENYESPDRISCLVWSPPDGGDPISKYISITWLNEPVIVSSREAQVFQVLVNFCSPNPIALDNYLVFVDSNGTYCTVLVTAISDNSAVTTHAFLVTRTSKYKIIRDAPASHAAEKCKQNKENSKSMKPMQSKAHGKKILNFRKESGNKTEFNNSMCTLPIDKCSWLVVQVTKSMSRPTQLGFVNTMKNFGNKKSKDFSSTGLTLAKSKIINSLSHSDSHSGALSTDCLCKENENEIDVTHPNFPFRDNLYGKHFHQTLAYLERWMFEVVMRCDQYFTIPKSFQKLRNLETKEILSKKYSPRNKINRKKGRVEKDFLDFLEEVVEPSKKTSLPQRISFEEGDRVKHLHSVYSEVLQFLNNQGCLLPHVKPEHLFNYEDYLKFITNNGTTKTFTWNMDSEKILFSKISKDYPPTSAKVNGAKDVSFSTTSLFNRGPSWRRSFFDNFKNESEDNLNEEEEEEDRIDELEKPEGRFNLREEMQFVHETEILDEVTMEARSTQAWFDVIIQIFRTLILTKTIYYFPTMPDIEVIGVEDYVCVDVVDIKSHAQNTTCDKFVSLSVESNLYTFQERILLMWLNYHFDEQRDHFSKIGSILNARSINNFDKDLADCIPLILVTAAYCPYMIPEYFSDIFINPDTQSKMYHNAGKLILAWRTLNVGLTVESTDLINPNPVFMIMLITQLYKFLPTLHPRYQLNCTAPLSLESTKTIRIRNDYQEDVFYHVKLIGEYEGTFRLKNSPSMISVKPKTILDVHIIFTARKIKRNIATLVLCGCAISPNFVQHLSFTLEGEPSNLKECAKLTLTAPLYKVFCTEIPVSPPYVEPTTYEIWYTTDKPVYKESFDISLYVKPWSKIWNRKVSRRLFLNKSEITINSGEKSAALGAAVACITEEERDFWLFFRSQKIGDFIIWVNIKVNTKIPLLSIKAFLSESFSKSAKCLCPDGGKILKANGSNSRDCPFLTEVPIPLRNDFLWNSLKNMFLRTLYTQEKSFWSKHFEKNIGLCLILWFMSEEEEEAVADEFIHVLQTRVTYTLKVDPPNNNYVTVPEKVDIPDVRKKSDLRLPVHISKDAPEKLKFCVTMTSENRKEIRKYEVRFTTRDYRHSEVTTCDGSRTNSEEKISEKKKLLKNNRNRAR